MKISDINVEFAPSKIPFPNSLQIDYLKVRNVIIVAEFKTDLLTFCPNVAFFLEFLLADLTSRISQIFMIF